MGVRLSHLRNNSRPLTIDLGDDIEVNVQYKPMSITPEQQEEFSAMMGDEKYIDAMCTFIPNVIASWDLTDDDDKPFPIEPKLMREQLPMEFINRLVKDVFADMYPKEKSEGSFGAT